MSKVVAAAALAVLIGWGATTELAAAQEVGWVRGAPLNLRRGAGIEFRIIGSVQPGDRVEIISRGAGWTQARTAKGREGWIASGYLDAIAPPTTRLTQLESETRQLKTDLDLATREVGRLETSYQALSDQDSEQRSEIVRLERLAAGSVWAERIAGALILCTGMVLGAIWHRLATRSRGTRLRL